MTTRLEILSDWVAEAAELTQPGKIHWCTGTLDEYRSLVQEMLASGDLLQLNQDHYPDCYLHRSDPQDVARVEHLTFVCSQNELDAGFMGSPAVSGDMLIVRTKTHLYGIKK